MAQPQRRQREVKPRNYASENKRPTISFRVRPDMVEKLKASAEERDLSLSEEVERSLNFKFDFARDAHDELVMRSIRTAIDMAEKLAGERWFENPNAATLCHAAIVKAADLLILGLGQGDETALNEATDEVAVAISSVAVNQTAGFGMTEARRRYEEAVASYRHFDRERYIMDKTTAEAGLPSEWATRPLTAEEFEAFKAGAPAEPSARFATPDEIAGAVPAESPERPASIFAQADFDEAAAGLPIEKAERAAEAKRRGKAPLDVGTVPVQPTAPKKRGRPRKASAGA